MPNYNKHKGDRFESATLLATQVYFPKAKRTRAGWDDDRGDIIVCPDYSVIAQCKDVASKSWYVWLDELDSQVKNAGALHGVLVAKRRGVASADEAMAVMRYKDWLKLLSRAVL